MAQLGGIPDWLGAALIGAAIAFIGFVGKSLVAAVDEHRAELRVRRAQLVELHSLLRAGRVTFVIQNGHAQRLTTMLQRKTDPPLEIAEAGYEAIMAAACADMNPAERELHELIRSMTINGLRPTNQAMLEWLKRDVYYKAQRTDHSRLGRLAELLGGLEAHLILWHAKYEAWIPNSPEHALVYLADESRHGVGFPSGLDGEVERLLGLRGEGRPRESPGAAEPTDRSRTPSP